MSTEESRRYHGNELSRIRKELDSLGNEFADDGIIRFVLNERIETEKASV